MSTLTNGSFYGGVQRNRAVAGITLAETGYGPGFRVPPHDHAHPFFCLTLKGTFTERFERRVWTGQPTTVFYHPAAAVRGWLLLRRLGHPRVRVLRDGILGWVDGVLSPVMPAFTPEQKRRFDQVAEVSRYFGGVARVGMPGAGLTDSAPGPQRTEEATSLITRRGCY